MQPLTHSLILQEATGLLGAACAFELSELQGGCDDEDVHIVQVLGLTLRLQAFGLSHSQRPGSSRGELWAPSAGARCERLFLAAARRAGGAPPARLLGRACHLLADAAVPSRARGVWHFRGDPLEQYLEETLPRPEPGSLPEEPAFVGAGALCRALAERSALLAADTTRTLWGAALHQHLGVGQALERPEIERQAAEVLPRAIVYTAALLRAGSALG